MPIYHFTEENIKECVLRRFYAERILAGKYDHYDINDLCWWSITKNTFGLDFELFYDRVNDYRDFKLKGVYRDFLEQFLAYYNPVVDLDIDDDDCI